MSDRTNASENPSGVHPERAAARAPRRLGDRARLAGTRAAFGMLDRVAPDVGARWAARLWCTMPTTGGRRRDERPSVGEIDQVPRPDGGTLVTEAWGSGDPVYLLHGWGGWRGQLGAFVDPLVAAGRRVVALDTPSHGESEPGAFGPRRSTGWSSRTRCGRSAPGTEGRAPWWRTPSAAPLLPSPSRTVWPSTGSC